MNDSYEQIQRVRFILSVITSTIFGGGFLIGLIWLVFFLGSLAEQIH